MTTFSARFDFQQTRQAHFRSARVCWDTVLLLILAQNIFIRCLLVVPRSCDGAYHTQTTVTVPVVTSIFSSQHYVTKTSFTNKLYWSQVPNPPPPVSYPTPAPPPTTTAGATPSYVAQYLPSRLSSGCSCLLSPTSTPITTVSATTTATFGRSTSVGATLPQGQEKQG